MESPQHSNTPPRKSPRPFKGDRELIAEAAKCLRDRDIMIVEYGQQLMHRIGCPVLQVMFEKHIFNLKTDVLTYEPLDC